MGFVTHFLRSESVLQQMEDALVQNWGDMTLAARSLSIKLQAIVQWRLDDPEVEKRLRTAEMIGLSSIQSVAFERAIKGVEEDVYFQGNVVGQKIVYSDGLLSQILKAHDKAYKPEAANAPGVQVNVQIMPRADDYQGWLEMRKQTLAGNDPSVVTDPARIIEDASFTEVQDVSTLKDIL